MTDDYLYKDNDGFAILDGHRQGRDRRAEDERRTQSVILVDRHRDRRNDLARRHPGERRIGPVFTLLDLFLEHMSSLFIGLFLILTGLCMIMAGLTFLPVLGVFAGVVSIMAGAWFLGRAFRSTWPSA